MIAREQNKIVMSSKQSMDTHQDLEGCIDEREALEQAEKALSYALSKSFSHEAPDELLDAIDAALVAVQKRLSDICSVENDIYRKLKMVSHLSDVNSIRPNQYIYLIGTWEDGEFWCRGEYASEEAARSSYALLRQLHPEKHIELVEQIKTHKGLEYHHPKGQLC